MIFLLNHETVQRKSLFENWALQKALQLSPSKAMVIQKMTGKEGGSQEIESK